MNKQDLNNKIFIGILLIMSCVFLFYMIKNGNYVNNVDNRNSYRFTAPTINSLLTGKYQSKIDETIADQMPKYNYFKLLYLKISNYTNIKTIDLLNLDKYNKYIKLGYVNLYRDSLVYTPENININSVDKINNIVDDTDANVYFYFINTDSNYNFETETKSEVFNNIKAKLNISEDNIDSLDIESFDEYKKYFYRTDHHWNYEGSYKGYTDLVNLMGLNEISISGEECFNIDFFGSKIRDIAGIQIFTEDVCMYTYDLPEFEIYTSNKKIDYGHTLEEIKSSPQISYAYIYGSDYDEIKFINNDINNNKKLLIYSNSFSNAINKLLASNYKETYVIDGRYYNKKRMIDYINDNEIDDVLFLANNMLFQDNLSW